MLSLETTMCHHFLEKGKNGCWKLVQKSNMLEECITFLGTSPALVEERINLLEEYACYLYVIKSRSFNDARWKIFDKNYQRESKVPDLASLPPCHQVFLVHFLQSNYVAYTGRNSVQPIVALPDVTDNGCLATGGIN